jgi:Tfp pilus assembly protein PilP
MMKRHFIAGVSFGILAFLIIGDAIAAGPGGSEGKTVPLPPPLIATPELGTKATFAATPQEAPSYRYSAAGKADPFRPFIAMEPAPEKKNEAEPKERATLGGRLISPLQQADIKQFRLAGIAGDMKKFVAIVVDDGVKKFYPLFVGTMIGLNDGRVASILRDRVIVEEKVEDQIKKPKKKIQVRRITMMLHKDE